MYRTDGRTDGGRRTADGRTLPVAHSNTIFSKTATTSGLRQLTDPPQFAGALSESGRIFGLRCPELELLAK